jgi:dTDP-4-amino-4,6-dideoxygalactose transaminase
MGTTTDCESIISGDEKTIRTCHPVLPHDISELQNEFNDVFASSWITNFAKYSERLESRFGELLKVKHALTVANATTGLHMLLSILPKDSEVIVPSYTFPATVNSIVHAHLKPVFADVERSTCHISLKEVREKITPNTSAILAANTFGSPCQIEELEGVARKHQIKLFFDSATAIGAQYRGRPLGAFGDAEVFSLSATKIVTAGEGGFITTQSDELAEELRCKRNYGCSKGAKDCLYVGFNGKMSEFNAIIALWSLRNLEHEIAWRKKIAAIYYERLQTIPGIYFQKILAGGETNFCAFAIEIDVDEFGYDGAAVQERLKREGIETLRYFCPPMHKAKAYRDYNHIRLEQSEALSQRNLCLPMHAHLTVEQAYTVCDAIEMIHNDARQIMQKRVAVGNRQPATNKKKQSNFVTKAPQGLAEMPFAPSEFSVR